MPDVENYSDEEEWMGVCVPKMMDEGRDNDQAVAACASMWKEKKSVDVVYIGGEIKALGNGKVGGYLVRFTDDKTPDLTGDYFDAKTDITVPDTLPLFYNHGMDATIKKRVIGSTTTRKDAAGIWAESQLNMRDKYEQKIYELAEAGKLGYSSGALSHLVEREPVGKSFHIKTWVIGEASLTPTPADHNNVVSIKSLLDAEEPAKDNIMEENKVDVKSLVAEELKAALAARDAEVKAEADRQAAIKAAEDAGYQKAITDLKDRKPVYHSTTPADDDNDGVGAFKSWLASGQKNDGLIQPDSSMLNIKAAFNITDGATGGYLVPDPLLDRIIAKRNLASWVRQAPVQNFVTESDHLLIPIEATSHHAFVLTAESAAYDEDEGTVDQADLALLKYTKEVRVTEEFLSGKNSNWESWLTDALGRSVAVTENTVATAAILSGAGTATAAASGTAITAAEIGACIGALGAGYNVPSECGFLTKNATKWYLKGLTPGYFAFNATPTAPDLFGYPNYVSDDMAAMTAGLKAVLFANFSYFAVLERPGMLVQRNPYLYMANGQIGIFANIYRAFKTLQTEAVKTMAMAG